ncbi:unnamed protein product [Meganyctiphanes norvegica]|uniref:Protein sleepless n=1 Tax=Meganyctiphanes norvegica TaxID=48144 RepID=A0AAV2SGC3_MEGNR
MKLLLAVVVLVALMGQGKSLQCYYCTNNPISVGIPQDPNCGNTDYSTEDPSFIEEWSGFDGCLTRVYSDGKVERDGAFGNFDDGECDVGMFESTECFCHGDLCNIDLCEGCDA